MGLTDSQKWLVLATFGATGFLLYVLAPILTPFLVSALLAYLGDPIVDRLQRLGLPRAGGVVIVFAVMLIAAIVGLLFLLPALQKQIVALIGRLPDFIDWVEQSALPWVTTRFGLDPQMIDIAALKEAATAHWREIGNVAKNLLLNLGRSGQLIFAWVAYVLLVPVVTFYLMRDWDELVAAVNELLPRRIAPKVAQIAREIDAVLAEFLRGQLTVMLALAVIYASGLWLVGLDLAFVVGAIAGLVSFVPYLGVIVGVILAGVAAVLQFHDLPHLLGVAAVFAVGQTAEGMVLSPLLVGDRIGLHPVAVMFAVMAGGQLFGFFGILLALPVAAVIVVLLRHSRDQYKSSMLYAHSDATHDELAPPVDPGALP
ncbi:MAG: AI-2E family transporter [Gammaproteobacteria bacterium]|nr:AI-2E family transporter [Gammaproteobacteria bacterium]MBI5618491.1 AI-2E family transporter [Gammaproteobacteria bacterium]